MAKDYYKTLGIARNATKEDIKKSYRRLAHQYHPDKGGDEKLFKEINEAYHVLSDENKRAQYDQFGQVFEGGAGGPQGGFSWPGGIRFDFGGGTAESRGFGDFDFADVFEDFFGGEGMGRRRAPPDRGRDLRIGLEVSFEEAIMGAKKETMHLRMVRCPRCSGSGGEPGTKIKTCEACQGKGHIQKTQRTILGSFTQVTTCPECRGEGKRPERPCAECRGLGIAEKDETLEIFVPRGVRDGEVLKITGKGDASAVGRTPGDLFIEIAVQPHPVFRRQGDDIVIQLPLKFSQLALGAAVDVDALDGAVRLKIPEGTQPGDILSIRGKGAWRASGYGRGDMLVEIKIDVPKRASKHAKDLLRRLEEEGF